MFLDLFYGLRAEGVPVALQEWMTFLAALKRGLHGSSLLRFYHLARACLIKSETYFDASTASSRTSSRASRARSTSPTR
jgi:uncharacterized protein with von Willebrand factor type A (vWA) domain